MLLQISSLESLSFRMMMILVKLGMVNMGMMMVMVVIMMEMVMGMMMEMMAGMVMGW